MAHIDPVIYARDLVRLASITPNDAGTLDVLQKTLGTLGFDCTRYPFGDGAARVDNLYARLGAVGPNFCYAGHVDVVPVGNAKDWRYDPFTGTIADGRLWGRGASDMKGGIAAYIAAVAQLLDGGWRPKGSISFLITADEEGPAINGTKKVLEAITKNGEIIDHCLVGEPTNPNTLGEMIKIGRRGSLNGVITVQGVQGHAAYPQRACNPVPVLLDLLARLSARKLDGGNGAFQPSNLEITSVDVGNKAHNIIPAKASARFNIRFNTEHRGTDLLGWIQAETARIQQGYNGDIHLDLTVPGLPFLTEACGFVDMLVSAITKVTGQTPELSTSGGTSDARFITHYAKVVEFGLIGKTIHKIDEYAEVSDIKTLCEIYKAFLLGYFKA